MSKKRANKYEDKVSISASFEDIVKVMLRDPKKTKKKAAKKPKPKK